MPQSKDSSSRKGKEQDRHLVTTPTLWDVLEPAATDPPAAADQEASAPLIASPIIGAVSDISSLVGFYDGALPRLRAASLAEEAAFRRRIIAEAHDGQIALDGLYLRVGSQAHVGHVPNGEIVDRSRWIARHNELTWEIPLDALPVREQLEREAEKQQIPVAQVSDQLLQTTVIDVAERLVGAYAARVMHGLYQAANDCWRMPIFRLDLNAFLTLLGLTPDKYGHHRGEARAELRDTLQALQAVNLIWEGEMYENGERIFRQVQRPLISILATDYRERENPGKERRRPSHVIVGLGWYQGVRRPDGQPGTDYIRIQRLHPGLGNASHHRTDDALGRRLLMIARYRLNELERRKVELAPTDSVAVTLTRRVALERAGITTTNVTWQRKTLEKALAKLIAAGTVVAFEPIPAKPEQSFAIHVAVASLMTIALSKSDEEALQAEERASIPADLASLDEAEAAHANVAAPAFTPPAIPNWPPAALELPPAALASDDRIYVQQSQLGLAHSVLMLLCEAIRDVAPLYHALARMQACWIVRAQPQAANFDHVAPEAFVLLTKNTTAARQVRKAIPFQLEACARQIYKGFPPIEVVVLPHDPPTVP
jgi:hypothetical protein